MRLNREICRACVVRPVDDRMAAIMEQGVFHKCPRLIYFETVFEKSRVHPGPFPEHCRYMAEHLVCQEGS